MEPVALLPKRARQYEVMRRRIRIESTLPKGITFKLADRRDEIVQACRILYSGYTQAGFMKEDGSGYRFTSYHAMPSSYTLVAKDDDRVIATVTIIVKSCDPLPIEKICSLEKLQSWDRRIAEISALTISSEYRNLKNTILFSMLKYMYYICKKVLSVTDLVLTCNPKHIAFYEAILLYKRISEETIESYDLANGAPAVAAWRELTTLAEDLERVYGGLPPDRNLHDFTVVKGANAFDIFGPRASVYSGNRWSPSTLKYLLENLAKEGSALSAEELRALASAYGPRYGRAFAKVGRLSDALACAQLAKDTNMNAAFIPEDGAGAHPVCIRRTCGQVLVVTAADPGALLGRGRIRSTSDSVGAPIDVPVRVGWTTNDGFTVLHTRATAPAWRDLVGRVLGAFRIPSTAMDASVPAAGQFS